MIERRIMTQFMIVKNGDAIKCLNCGMVSHHPKDVSYRYCGKCHRFMDMSLMDKMGKDPGILMDMGPDATVQFLNQHFRETALKKLVTSLEEIKKDSEAAHAKIDRDAKYFNALIWAIAAVGFLSIFLRLLY